MAHEPVVANIVVTNVGALSITHTEENWPKTFQVDLMHAVRAALPHLERSPTASIVTAASVAGREIDPGAFPYGAFKAFLIHTPRSWPGRWCSWPARLCRSCPAPTW